MTTKLTTHEKLKWICDKIGYNPLSDNKIQWWVVGKEYYKYSDEGETVYVDEREIIFNQEFWNKFIWYTSKVNLNKAISYNKLLEDLFEYNLDNPTEYLYNLIK